MKLRLMGKMALGWLWFQSVCFLMGASLFYATHLDYELASNSSVSRISLHAVQAVDFVLAPQANLSDMLVQDEARVQSLNWRLGNEKLSRPQATSIPLKPGLSIGSGNYYIKIGLGTPPKYYTMLIDTGSSFSWLQCTPCEFCHPQMDPLFDPKASKTYKSLSCSSSTCSSIRAATLNDPACDSSTNDCIYTASYGDRSFSVGVLSQDVLTLTPSQTLPGFLYGCGMDNMGLFGKAAGLIGLGRHGLSVIGQTSAKYGSLFSYCLPTFGFGSTPNLQGSGTGGFLSVGKTAAADARFKFTPMIRNQREPSLYFLKLTSITISGRPLGVNAGEYTAPTIIDSGTVITRLPTAIYSSLKQSLVRIMTTQFKYKQAPAFSLLDTCFVASSKAAPRAPLVQMIFSGGADLSLGPANLLIQVTEGVSCLAFADGASTGDLIIIGNHQQQTFEVAYDTSRSRIGFSSHGCT